MDVLGIDPGIKTLGAALRRGSRFVYADAWSWPQARDARDAIAVVEALLVRFRPDAVVLEDFEPQPWRANGRLPKGAVAGQRAVSQIRDAVMLAGVPCVMASPLDQASYPEEVVRAAVARVFRGGVRACAVPPHAVAAARHALAGESKAAAVVRALRGG